ncbi:MAG: hypothetical protein ABIH90_01705, partial [Candidatus Aenigmatarchaeota archaeon]
MPVFADAYEIETDRNKPDFFEGKIETWEEADEIYKVEFQYSKEYADRPDVNTTIKLFSFGNVTVTGEKYWVNNRSDDKKAILKTTVQAGREWKIRFFIEMVFESGHREYANYVYSSQDGAVFNALSSQTEENVSDSEVAVFQQNVEFAESHTLYGEESVFSSLGKATVNGYWYYEDIDGNLNPVRGATIIIMADGIIDYELGRTTTNSYGYYSFSPEVGDGKNIYIKIICETDAAKVTDGNILGYAYWSQSTTKFV